MPEDDLYCGGLFGTTGRESEGLFRLAILLLPGLNRVTHEISQGCVAKSSSREYLYREKDEFGLDVLPMQSCLGCEVVGGRKS